MALEDFKTKSEQIIDRFKKEISSVRTGRPSTALVEDLRVSYYNQPLAINQLGSLRIVPPRSIVIEAWDKEAVPGIVKAIETSRLNLGASVEGNTIIINLPELTYERREELSKHVKRLSEEYRIQLRHLRDETNKEIQGLFGSHDITEDQKFKLKEEIQKQVDKINEIIEEIVERKIKEINE